MEVAVDRGLHGQGKGRIKDIIPSEMELVPFSRCGGAFEWEPGLWVGVGWEDKFRKMN